MSDLILRNMFSGLNNFKALVIIRDLLKSHEVISFVPKKVEMYTKISKSSILLDSSEGEISV